MNRPREKLLVYSAVDEKFCKPLVDGFRNKHPEIDLDFQGGISVALHESYLAALAAGEPKVDLFWSSGMDLQMGLVASGHASTYRSPEASFLPVGAVLGDMAYATTLEPLVTLVNRSAFDPAARVGSLAEIAAVLEADAEGFRERVACYDVERNGLGFLALLHESLNDEAFERFMHALGPCRPRIFSSNPGLVDDVASGRASIAYHVLSSFALRAVRDNPGLAIAASHAPPLAVSRVAFIPKTAPSPAAARKFLDHLISEAGQQGLHEAGLYPIRADVAGHGTSREVEPISLHECATKLLDETRRQAVLARWKQAIGH